MYAFFGVWLPPLVVALVAGGLWLLFYPGILTFDSILQYDQAVTGKFEPYHPPIMSVMLSAMLAIGGDIQHLVLAQCLWLLLGIYYLAVSLMRALVPGSIGSVAARYLGLVAVLILLAPISPLPHFAVTFWKDVWLAAALIGLAALWLNRGRLATAPTRTPCVAFMAAFLLLTTLAVTVRHNSVVVLPVLSVMFVLCLRSRGIAWKIALPALFAPALLFQGAQMGIESAFHIEKVPMGHMVQASDLTAICYYYPELQDSIPYTRDHLRPEFRQVYYVGHADIYGPCHQPNFYGDVNAIAREHDWMVIHHPMKILNVKSRKFNCHLTDNPSALYCTGISANRHGLKENKRFAKQRDWLHIHLWETFHDPVYRWVFCRHAVWFWLAAVVAGGNLVLWRVLKSELCRDLLLLALIPLFYDGSFFLVSFSADFRYLYPSSLIMQALTVTACLAALIVVLQRAANLRAYALLQALKRTSWRTLNVTRRPTPMS